MSFQFDVPKKCSARIKVFGVGGGGGNAVNSMISSGLVHDVDFIIANTDMQALSASPAPSKLQLGTDLCEGLGAGADPTVGRDAAHESKEHIIRLIDDADMVFVTAGMGGGTGTGAAPVIAEAAMEAGALVVGVVTKPFKFEGKRRLKQAEQGINELTKYVDSLICIPNQQLISVATKTTTLVQAFKKVDDVLLYAVKGIADVVTEHGLINQDFRDVRAVMEGMGLALMGVGEAEGDDRALIAMEEAINSPLLENVSIDGARGLLINVAGGNDFGLMEADEAMCMITDRAHEDAQVIWGQSIVPEMGDRVRITVIATGFKQRQTRHTETRRRVASIVDDGYDEPTVVRMERTDSYNEGAAARPMRSSILADDVSVSSFDDGASRLSRPAIFRRMGRRSIN